MEILAILLVIGFSCALLGVFVVGRDLAMVTDAISHTVLLGIVLTYFVVRDINSPWLKIGASMMGVATCVMIDRLNRLGIYQKDAAIATVFALIFAVAIILISKYARHDAALDTDVVLMGEIIFAPLERVTLGPLSLPYALVSSGVAALANVVFVSLFYRRLVIATCDTTFAETSGIATQRLHYVLMALVSLTSVVAFESVGAILVISFFIAPVATAWLFAKNTHQLICCSLVVSAAACICAYVLGMHWNVSISGMGALANGIIFLMVLGVRQAYRCFRKVVLFS